MVRSMALWASDAFAATSHPPSDRTRSSIVSTSGSSSTKKTRRARAIDLSPEDERHANYCCFVHVRTAESPNGRRRPRLGKCWAGSFDLLTRTELSRQRVEGAVLQRLRGAHGSSRHRGDGFERQVGHEAQGDHLALVGGERRDCREQVGIDRFGRRRYERGVAGPGAVASEDAASLVDNLVVGDGEHPSAQRVVVAVEAIEPSRDRKEYVAEQLVTVGDAARPQVTEHRRGEGAEDRFEVALGRRVVAWI